MTGEEAKKFDAFFEANNPKHYFLRLNLTIYQLLLEMELPKEVVEDEDVLKPDIPTDLQAIGLTQEFFNTVEGREWSPYTESVEQLKKWLEHRCRFAQKDNTTIKAIMCCNYLYGLDPTEWDSETEKVVLHDSMNEGKMSLRDWIVDETQAFEEGHLSAPYAHDDEIRLVFVEEDKLIDVMTEQEYEMMQP